MSRYRESILTDKGLDLARKAANGIIKITFTKGVLSADAHQNDNIQTVEGLTTLNAFVQSDSINYVTPSDDANVNVPLRFHNTNMTTDGYINTVGLYATDGTTEVLYSVIINDDPELFAAYNGTTPESVKINHTTQVGRADQVNVQVSPMGMVTEEEFQSATSTTNSSLAANSTAASNNTVYIATVEKDKNAKMYTADFNSFKQNENFQFRGPWSGDITQLVNQADGIWQIANNTQGVPEGFNGFGIAVKYHNGPDNIIHLYDNNTGQWTHTDYSNWYQLATTNESYFHRGIWKNSILALKDQQDGYYSILSNYTDAPNGFSGYGLALVKHDAVNDTYIVVQDNANGEWHNHFGNGSWNGWQRVATQTDVDNATNNFNTLNNANKDIMRRISTGFLHNWKLTTFYMNNPYPTTIPQFWFDETNNTLNFQGSIAVNSGDWICFENNNILDYMNANGYSNFTLDSQFMNYQNVGQQSVFIRPNVKCGVIQFQANFSGIVNLNGCWLKVDFS